MVKITDCIRSDVFIQEKRPLMCNNVLNEHVQQTEMFILSNPGQFSSVQGQVRVKGHMETT